MKGLEHHVKQLLKRMMQAQEVTDRERARKILRKAEKHREKLERAGKCYDTE